MSLTTVLAVCQLYTSGRPAGVPWALRVGCTGAYYQWGRYWTTLGPSLGPSLGPPLDHPGTLPSGPPDPLSSKSRLDCQLTRIWAVSSVIARVHHRSG